MGTAIMSKFLWQKTCDKNINFYICFSAQDSKFSYVPSSHVYAWIYDDNENRKAVVLYHIL